MVSTVSLCQPLTAAALYANSSSLSLAADPSQALSSAQLRRNRDKLVSLLEEGQLSQLASGEVSTSVTAPGNLAGTPGEEDYLATAADEPSPTSEGVTGRITIYCTAARWWPGLA